MCCANLMYYFVEAMVTRISSAYNMLGRLTINPAHQPLLQRNTIQDFIIMFMYGYKFQMHYRYCIDDNAFIIGQNFNYAFTSLYIHIFMGLLYGKSN